MAVRSILLLQKLLFAGSPFISAEQEKVGSKKCDRYLYHMSWPCL